MNAPANPSIRRRRCMDCRELFMPRASGMQSQFQSASKGVTVYREASRTQRRCETCIDLHERHERAAKAARHALENRVGTLEAARFEGPHGISLATVKRHARRMILSRAFDSRVVVTGLQDGVSALGVLPRTLSPIERMHVAVLDGALMDIGWAHGLVREMWRSGHYDHLPERVDICPDWTRAVLAECGLLADEWRPVEVGKKYALAMRALERVGEVRVV